MKSLLLLRHAKSSWKEPGLTDHDRPLNKRGRRDAPRMGRLLLDEHLVPDCIISSTARRARLTAEAVAEVCDCEDALQLDADLYHGAPESMLEVIRGLPPSCGRALLVGHNPGLEELLERLAGTVETLPTAALVHLELPVDEWSQAGGAEVASTVAIWRPRELSDGG
ncbi:MAG: SixA phosphatase family protein [Planctomycetota bacterium]